MELRDKIVGLLPPQRTVVLLKKPSPLITTLLLPSTEPWAGLRFEIEGAAAVAEGDGLAVALARADGVLLGLAVGEAVRVAVGLAVELKVTTGVLVMLPGRGLKLGVDVAEGRTAVLLAVTVSVWVSVRLELGLAVGVEVGEPTATVKLGEIVGLSVEVALRVEVTV